MSPGRERRDPFEGREPRVFERRHVVTEAHLDELDHVNNVVYLRWIQDIARDHWREAADPEHVDAVAWVVSRHEIDYERPARLGDEIVVRTWVGATSGVRFERHTEIVGPAGETQVRGRTIWCPVDPETGKLTRLDVAAHEPFYR